MTQKQIAVFLSDCVGCSVGSIDVSSLCRDNGFKPRDVVDVSVFGFPLRFQFLFKKSFRYESITIPYRNGIIFYIKKVKW